ncbi:MAG: NAD(P)-binding domain-containing protein, partial [Polyangiaceae bacterium]
TVRASRVLLAIGRRGTPRMLEAPVTPAAATRVVHALSDARALAGKHVVVVGLGDSAMEAVVALARQPRTTVTVSYRGAGFARGKARNIDEVRRLVAAGRVTIHFESTVERVDDGWVVLRTPRKEAEKGGEERRREEMSSAGETPSQSLLPSFPPSSALPPRVERVRADVVLALLGGVPSRGLLDAAGVRVEGA